VSVPKLISPLLDGFVMGDAISSHDGVRCCPAMRVSDSSKYIVKIISLPTSQTKLDALLLAGAFDDRASALNYFHELSRDVVEEAVLLQRLSRLEGFAAYENWQVVPMDEEDGYDVYLLAPYHKTLERIWQKEPLTHLQAVNLGLDLCSALAACRRSGWLYADLKPENICIYAGSEYRISDIGFINLASLNYASLPERCLSAYTAPEITDAYSALNDTLDTYAAGMILYQVFNGGVLPEAHAAGQSFRAPEYADMDMAQIILKACAPDPADRWRDPIQMGQALVSYMQSHSVNDTPIIPVPEEAEPEESVEAATEGADIDTDDILAQADQALEAATVFPEEVEEAAANEAVSEDVPVEVANAEETEVEESETEEAVVEEPETEETVVEEPEIEETVVEEPEIEETVVEEPETEEVTIEEPEAEETVVEEPETEEVTVEEPETEETVVEESETEETVVEESETEEVTVEEPETEEAVVEESETEETVVEEPETEETMVEETETEEAVVEETETEEAVVEETETEEAVVEESDSEEVTVEEPETEEAVVEEPETEEVTVEEPEAGESEAAEAEAEEEDVEIPIPAEPAENQNDAEDSEDLGNLLEQADELIAHELPDPVVVPEAFDIPIPTAPRSAAAPEEQDEEVPAAPGDDEEPEFTPPVSTEPQTPELEEDEEIDEEAVKPKRKLGWLITTLILLLLLAAGCIGGYLFYHNYYLQPILGMELAGSEDRLTVTLNTQTDNSLLTVYCTDSYGNTKYQPVMGNTATFTGLSPSTHYRIHVEIEGLHKLIGITADTYTTDEQTTISGFSAVAGDADGAVILNFAVQGPETSEWKLLYSCPGESERELIFTGHTVTVTGLTVGKTYTFRLEPVADLYVVGEDTLDYTVTGLIYAQQLTIESFIGGKLTAVWQTPEGVTVNSWTVRCTGDNGMGKTYVVTDPKAVFDDLTPEAAYTIQVTAEGMTVSATAFITANSITVESVEFDDTTPGKLTLRWNYQGAEPEGGWLVLYTASGMSEQQVIRTDSASATLSSVIPGTSFTFTIQTAGGSTVFGGSAAYEAPAAPTFSGFMLTAADLTFRMCKTPVNPAWSQADVPEADYVNTFAPGEKASFAIFIGTIYGISEESVRTLAVIRDENGNVVDTVTVTRSWSSMWYKSFGKLDLFELPANPGNYTVEVYFNEMLVTTQHFTVA